jgi:hypothetical protein
VSVLQELREAIGADLPVSDAALLCGAATLLESLDQQVEELRAEVAALRREHCLDPHRASAPVVHPGCGARGFSADDTASIAAVASMLENERAKLGSASPPSKVAPLWLDWADLLGPTAAGGETDRALGLALELTTPGGISGLG